MAVRDLLQGRSYFEYQVEVGREVVVPWLVRHLDARGLAVADFGAHHGGLLEAFRAAGAARGVGYELRAEVVADSPFVPDERFRLEIADLRTLDLAGEFDLVVIHEVLEHVVEPDAVLAASARAVRPGGAVFVSFPPYYSPWGGHQHLAAGPARVVPYLHYLPERLFVRLARPADTVYMGAEAALEDTLAVRRTRLTIAKAEQSFAAAGLSLSARDLYLSRPEYRVRYRLPTLRVGPIARVPLLREVLVTGAFYLLRKPAVARSA